MFSRAINAFIEMNSLFNFTSLNCWQIWKNAHCLLREAELGQHRGRILIMNRLCILSEEIPQDNEDVIRIRITQIINGLLKIVMFQNGLIIGDIQGRNKFSTPRFSFDSLGHDKG